MIFTIVELKKILDLVDSDRNDFSSYLEFSNEYTIKNAKLLNEIELKILKLVSQTKKRRKK